MKCKTCGQEVDLKTLEFSTMAQRFNFLRDQSGYGVRELAREVGLAPTTITRVGLGKNVTIHNINLIAKFFNVSLDYLVNGKDPQ